MTGHSVVPAPVTSREGAFGLHGFFIPLGPVGVPRTLPYALNAPTTSKNLVRKHDCHHDNTQPLTDTATALAI